MWPLKVTAPLDEALIEPMPNGLLAVLGTLELLIQTMQQILQ